MIDTASSFNQIIIKTSQEKELVDITSQINRLLKDHSQKTGLCHLFILHTTAALATVYLNPRSDLLVASTTKTILPKNHDMMFLPSHVIASFLGSTLFIPYQDGALILGPCQRVVLIELGGPNQRKIVFSCN